jgi:hypothetical protein
MVDLADKLERIAYHGCRHNACRWVKAKVMNMEHVCLSKKSWLKVLFVDLL